MVKKVEKGEKYNNDNIEHINVNTGNSHSLETDVFLRIDYS